MKNIHILPTDKPSKLYFHNLNNKFGFSTPEPMVFFGSGSWAEGRNIYITSDEEIKDGVDQWYLDKVLIGPYNSGGAQYSSKQDVIIMTTDQDLIEDGVQAIDDEFLEWFVKNPSCERVEVEKWTDYKIIIPSLVDIPNGDDFFKEGKYTTELPNGDDFFLTK